MIKTKYRFILLICCISLSLILGISSQSEAVNSEDEFEEVLIHLSHEAEIDSKAPREKVIDSLQQAAGNSQASLLDFLENKQEKNYVGEIKSYYVANVIYAELTPGLFERVEDRSDVEQVYPNEELSFNLPTPQGAVSAHGIDFPWNLEHIKADEVWNKYDIEGEGVVIGIIDTGVDWEHPALKKSWRGYEAKEVDYNWFDPINEASMPNDQHGHGSHVAGIAVGHDEDAGIKIGAAPGAQWIAARGLSDYGSGYLEDLIAAGEFMLAPTDLEGDNPDPDKAPDIIINSWGIENVDGEWYNEMIENWRKADILPVFAAGYR